MADKAVINRIKKLLALAKDNASKNEATAAALRAQQLIAEYDVSKEELHEDEQEEITEVNSGNIKGNPWSKALATTIADNFRCRYYLHSNGRRSWVTRRVTKSSENVVFIGYDTDANAATVTFDRLFEMGNRLADAECRAARAKYGTAQGVRNSFLLGFVEGIRKELEKQCVALMLVRPKAVDDYTEQRTAGFRSSSYTVRSANDATSYDNGVGAGRDSVRSARLGGQKALTA